MHGAASIVVVESNPLQSSVAANETKPHSIPRPSRVVGVVASRHRRASRAPFPFALPFALALVARVVVRHRTAIDPRIALVVVALVALVVVAIAIARVARSIARRIGRASISDESDDNVSRRV